MIRLDVFEGKLILTAKGVEDFETFHSLMKAPGSGSYWDKERKVWRVKPATWERLYDQLDDLDMVVVTMEAERFIENSRSVPERIVELDDGFNLKELVVPPLKGKHPFEDYQIEDLYNLITHNRFGLYNEQGTGKSWELISMAHLRYERGQSRKIIFYTSNSGVYNIRFEFAKFSKIPANRITVAGVENRRPFDDPEIDVILTNYGSMRLVEAEYRRTRNDTEGPMSKFTKRVKKWLNGDPGTLICDEAQAISNYDSQQSTIVHHLGDLCFYTYPATGTPADTEEKWYSQLRLLDPKLVKNMTYSEWCSEYFYRGNDHSSAAIGLIKPEKKAELQALVDTYCVRRFAGDVLNLPEHLMRDIYIPMTKAHKDIYQSIVLNKMVMLQRDDMGLVSEKVVQSFPYLILALDNPKLLLKHEERIADQDLVQKLQQFDFIQDHAKFDALFDLLDKHKGQKVIIWNSHPTVAHELEVALKRYKPLSLHGESKLPKKTSRDDYKMQLVTEFQESPTRNIFILGQQVMNSSVNIVKANVQIIWDVNYDYVQFDQMLKRVHRYGQLQTVYTYFLIMDKSLDVARRMILKDKDWINKKFLTEEYLTGQTAKKLFNLSREDVEDVNAEIL